MNYLKVSVLLACLLLLRANAITDITLLNCPAQYNLTYASDTVNASVNLLEFFFGGQQGSEDAEKMKQIVISGDYDAFDSFTRQKMVPYIIIGAIVLGIFLLLIFYCLFDKSWPPCHRFRRNAIEDPYTTTERRCMSFWLLFLAVTIFVAGIVSFTAIPNMKNYIAYTQCSIYYMLDVSLYGDLDNGWGGFVELKYKIGNISSLLDSASTQVSTYLSNDEWLVNDLTVMKNKNVEIYNSHKDAQLITPNPVTTETNINAGLDYPLIDSVFIQGGLGPNGTFGTMVDDIDRGLRTTETKSYQAYSIEIAAASMVESSATIQTNAVASQNTLAMYIRQLQVVNEEMNTFSSKFFQAYFSYGIYVLQGVVGFVLVSSLLILIGALSTHFYEIFECRYMVHCGWFLYGVMYFGVLVLGFTTLGIGTMGYNACSYFNVSLSDSSEYSLVADSYSQNVFNRLDTCILGSGDVLQKFDISDEMKVVMDLFTNISTYYDYDNPSSSNYVDLSISTGKISGWINAMDKYRLGVYIDSREEEQTNDNPNYAIQQLNLYSHEGGGVPTCSLDKWVFDSENCTDTNEITYTATSLESNGVQLSNDSVTCISFNEKLTTTMSSSWTQSDFTKRYIQIRQDCPDAYDKIIYYGYTLINFRDSRVNLYQSIKDDLQEIYDLNTDFNTVMESFRGRVDQFYESVATLNNIVANDLDGLLVTSNCQTIGDSAQVVYNIFCVNFLSEVAKVAMCVLILMITIIGGMCTGSIFGVRYANIHMLKRIGAERHEEIPQGSAIMDKMDNLGEKEIMFSERSQSSENDEEEDGKKRRKK